MVKTVHARKGASGKPAAFHNEVVKAYSNKQRISIGADFSGLNTWTMACKDLFKGHKRVEIEHAFSCDKLRAAKTITER